MSDELAELRGAYATLQSAKANNDRHLDAHVKKSAVLTAQRDDLMAALYRLYLACPISLDCTSFNHAKREQHSEAEACGPAQEYLKALTQARAAIGEKGMK